MTIIDANGRQLTLAEVEALPGEVERLRAELRELSEAASEMLDNLPQDLLASDIMVAHLGRLALALGDAGGDLGARIASGSVE